MSQGEPSFSQHVLVIPLVLLCFTLKCRKTICAENIINSLLSFMGTVNEIVISIKCRINYLRVQFVFRQSWSQLFICLWFLIQAFHFHRSILGLNLNFEKTLGGLKGSFIRLIENTFPFQSTTYLSSLNSTL